MAATPMVFAARLQKLREEKGFTQYALARMAGLTRQALSRLEKGEREPAWQTVQLLAKALGVDCREFADEDIEIPEDVDLRSRGRPRKAEEPAVEEPKKKPRKKKGK